MPKDKAEYSAEPLDLLVEDLLGDPNMPGEIVLEDIKAALQHLYERGWRLTKKQEYRPREGRDYR